MLFFQVNSIGGKQSEISDKYNRLIMLGETRKRKLEEACKGYQLLREANDLADWIRSRVSGGVIAVFPEKSLTIIRDTVCMMGNSVRI